LKNRTNSKFQQSFFLHTSKLYRVKHDIYICCKTWYRFYNNNFLLIITKLITCLSVIRYSLHVLDSQLRMPFRQHPKIWRTKAHKNKKLSYIIVLYYAIWLFQSAELHYKLFLVSYFDIITFIDFSHQFAFQCIWRNSKAFHKR